MVVSDTRRLWLAVVALGCSAAVVAFRLLGLHTWRGAQFDTTAVQDGLSQLASPRVAHATRALLDTISIASLATIGGGLLVYAIARRRRDLAFACTVLLGGANGTTQLLKDHLAGRGEAPSGLTHSFPSGHATVAMSLALAVLLVVPARLRFPAVVVGAVYATAIGVALVVTAAHFPSDVAGGFCVAGAWAGLAALFVTRPATGVPSVAVLLGLAIVAVAAVAIALATQPQALVRIHLHGRLVEAAVGIATVAVGVAVAFAYAIAARSASTTRS
jgi:membrane-associated phospholipid phosphatase